MKVKITDAYKTVATNLGYPESKHLRKLLEIMMTPEEAELAARLPAPAEELAKELNLDEEQVNNTLQDMYQKGLIFPCPEGYRMGNLQDIHGTALWDTRQDAHWGQKYFDAWKEFTRAEWYRDYGNFRAGSPGFDRVLPYYKAIENTPGALPDEDIREILKSKRTIALVPCACRRMEGNCDHTVETCMLLDGIGESQIERGCAKKISYEEAMAIVDQAEEEGLVHRTENIRAAGVQAICHCCNCCCLSFLSLSAAGKLHETLGRTRYECQIDQELCKGCQTCVERCQLDAIDMVKTPTPKKLKAAIDNYKCRGCGACVITCEEEALSLVAVRPPEFIPEENVAAEEFTNITEAAM